MNELEKEIGKQLIPFIVADKDREGSAFKKGADFVLSKNLPVLFAEWCFKTGWKKEWDKWTFHTEKTYPFPTDEKSGDELYDYWINNIYGK